jgi:hypothetical protein
MQREYRSFHRNKSALDRSSRSLGDDKAVSPFSVPKNIIDSEVTGDFEIEFLLNDGYVV